MIATRCVQRETMLQYLQGMVDQDSCDAIELHLKECLECEKDFSELEKDPKNYGLSGISESGPSVSVLDADHSLVEQVIDNAKNIPLEPASSLQNKTIGNYLIHYPVGQGGMAVVYKAENKKLGKTVALKILRTGISGPPLERIEREIQAHGRLNHPAIVSAIDAGEDGQVQYLITEFVDGMDLRKLVKSLGKLPIPDACEIIRQAALGIGAAHQEGIIHRDIKPSNIMIASDGSVKVLDFGLVFFEDWTEPNLELTSVGQLLGTLDYMAPEQAENPTSVDLRSDIYSLGATLFTLIAGRAPFAANKHQSPLEKLRLIAMERPPKLKTLCPETPSKLSDLVAECLSHDSSSRPASTAHLAEKLQPFCKNHQLEELLSTARKQNESSPEPIQSEPTLNLKNSGGNNGSSRNWWARIAIGLAFFGMLFFSIIFVIQTNQGQIVIEVPDDNVQLEVLSGGKVYHDVFLKPGVNSVQLFAGNYQIRIKEKPDSYQISGDKIVLGRGKTVLAKITKKAIQDREQNPFNSSVPTNNGASPGSGISNPGLPEDAPGAGLEDPNTLTNNTTNNTFDGKKIDHWLTIFLREQNVAHVSKAVDAINNLTNKSNEHLVRKVIAKTMAQAQPKLKNLVPYNLKIHSPFTEEELQRIDKAIEHSDPEIGMSLLLLKVHLSSDQLIKNFHKKKYRQLFQKTMEQLKVLDGKFSADGQLNDFSFTTSSRNSISNLLGPYLRYPKWESDDSIHQEIVNVTKGKSSFSNHMRNILNNLKANDFGNSAYFGNEITKPQKITVLRNLDFLQTQRVIQLLNEEKEASTKAHHSSFIQVRQILSKPRLITKTQLKELKKSLNTRINDQLQDSVSNGSLLKGTDIAKNIQERGGFQLTIDRSSTGGKGGGNRGGAAIGGGATSIGVPQWKYNIAQPLHPAFEYTKAQEKYLTNHPELSIVGNIGLRFFIEGSKNGYYTFDGRGVSSTATGGSWYFDSYYLSRRADQAPLLPGLALAEIYARVFSQHDSKNLPASVKKLILSDLAFVKAFPDPFIGSKTEIGTMSVVDRKGDDVFVQIHKKDRTLIGKPFRMPSRTEPLIEGLANSYFFFGTESLETFLENK